MSQSFSHGAEPFQGFTEFDELESQEEFDEFGESEFGDFELFENDFELEAEGERGRTAQRAARRRVPARPRGPSRGAASRTPRRRVPRRPRRPGIRPAGGSRRRLQREPGARMSRARGGIKRPRRRLRRLPRVVSAPDFVVRRPLMLPDSAFLAVGRFGNWFRSGDQVILLLDEDEKPLEDVASAAPAEDAADVPPEDASAAQEPEEEFFW